MQETMGPCANTSIIAHVVSAVSLTVTACFTAYLAHKRVVADRTSYVRHLEQSLRLTQIEEGVRQANEKIDNGASR